LILKENDFPIFGTTQRIVAETQMLLQSKYRRIIPKILSYASVTSNDIHPSCYIVKCGSKPAM
jgi:hypothetical protein